MQNIMDDRLIIQKESQFFLKVISVVVFLSIIIISRMFFKSNYINNDIELIFTFIETFGLVLSILACTSLLISYKRIKKDSIFVISLMYLTASISLGFQYLGSLTYFYSKLQFHNFDMINSWLLKSLLIIIALYPKNKLKSFIVNNKVKTVIFICFYMIFSCFLCMHFDLYTNNNLFIFINLFLLTLYLLSSVAFFLVGFKEKEYLYFVISSSMLILTIKSIYILLNINNIGFYQIIVLAALGYLVLLIIITGSFIELFLYVNSVKRLNNKLKIFYDLSNNNKHTALLICDKKGNILYSNDAFKNNYSYLKPGKNYVKVLKEPFVTYIPVDEVNKIKESLDKTSQWRDVIKVTDNNRFIDCSVQVINPRDENSPISVNYIDITDIINKELELERLNVYNIEQTEFISNISHELRTPIHIFYSTVQLLDKFCDKNTSNFIDIYKKYRKSLHINCNRMLRLVNNVIDISKLEIGMLKGDFQYYNLISIIEDVTLLVRNYAELKSINIHFDTNCEEFISKCDCNMIERAILNLLSNAIKFTDENKNIYVNIYGYDDYIDIHIKDEGCGISKKDIKHVFKRFFQGDKSLARKNEGSGIGLSIVKSIIDLHEGHISLESKVDTGSTFKVILPKLGSDPEDCNIFDISDCNTELELSDIYEVLI